MTTRHAGGGDNRKARQILDGARSAFIELGYDGTSVDEIARRAGVSKPTLYHYFADKRAVFAAFVRRECEEQSARIFDAADRPGDVGHALRHIARDYLAFLLSPFAQGIFRIVVAEAPRFPELGHIFYSSGPELGMRRLATYLERASARGELSTDDPVIAAHQFVELCKADLFMKRLFLIRDEVAPEEIRRVADAAVATFLRAYGAPGRPVSPNPSEAGRHEP